MKTPMCKIIALIASSAAAVIVMHAAVTVEAAIVTCQTYEETFSPAGGCNTDVNGDRLLEYHQKCTCTKYTKVCSNGKNYGWLSCAASVAAKPTLHTTTYALPEDATSQSAIWRLGRAPAGAYTTDSKPAIEAQGSPSAVPPRQPTATPSPSGGVEQATPRRFPQGDHAVVPRQKSTRLLQCKNGFAEITDPEGKPLEPIGPCAGADWTAEIAIDTDVRLR